MSISELAKLFESHKSWVNSSTKKGGQISLDKADLSNITADDTVLEQGYFSSCSFSALSFSSKFFYESEFYSYNFTDTRFENFDFRKSTMDYCIFEKAVFINCTFGRTDVFQATFDNCNFVNCSFVGFNLMESKLINTDTVTHISLIIETDGSEIQLSEKESLNLITGKIT